MHKKTLILLILCNIWQNTIRAVTTGEEDILFVGVCNLNSYGLEYFFFKGGEFVNNFKVYAIFYIRTYYASSHA